MAMPSRSARRKAARTTRHSATASRPTRREEVLSAHKNATSSDTADGEHDGERRSPISTRKTRKRSTYDVRRETKAALLIQIQQLQRQLEDVDETHEGDAAFDLQRALLRKRQLQKGVRAQQFTLAGAQSMLSGIRGCEAWQSPLSTFIHLREDMAHRRRVLAGLYDESIAVATAFIRERMRFVDLSHAHSLCESWERPKGEFVFTRFDVTPFGAGVSVKRVFDEILQHLNDQEISVSENLGMITIITTETDGDVASIRQNCLVSSLDNEIELESNTVTFSKFATDEEEGGPYGVTTVDYINQDDLLVGSAGRVRKDISACSFVCICPPAVHGEEPVVSLVRWSTLRVHAPPVSLTTDQAAAVRSHIRAWSDVMLSVVKQRLKIR